MSAQHIVFSHGQDGEPWGSKIVAMAAVARRLDFSVESVDYRGIADPAARVLKLLQTCKSLPGPLVLVGSSLGGHVCTAAARELPVRGLFLLAPAFYMPGYEQYTPEPPQCPIAIVHGWNDTVVPPGNSIRYAGRHKTTLHLIDSDHRLTANIDEVCELLERFLRRLPQRS
jgi:pimeloyl-ACP methyl ester carboxylesterase